MIHYRNRPNACIQAIWQDDRIKPHLRSRLANLFHRNTLCKGYLPVVIQLNDLADSEIPKSIRLISYTQKGLFLLKPRLVTCDQDRLWCITTVTRNECRPQEV